MTSVMNLKQICQEGVGEHLTSQAQNNHMEEGKLIVSLAEPSVSCEPLQKNNSSQQRTGPSVGRWQVTK